MSRQPRKRKPYTDNLADIQDFSQKRGPKVKEQRVNIIPRNSAQEEYLLNLCNEEKRIIFAIGPAGTGKSLIATKFAIRELMAGRIERIVITRPVVTVDEDLGFLPGNMLEKMSPFIRPIIDIFEETYDRKKVLEMIEDGTVEICPFAYIRGRTIKNAMMILDECQCTTPNQLKAALTRIGEGTRMVVTGDLRQADKGMDGLHDFLNKIEGKSYKDIGVVMFKHCHIERDPTVATILDIYGDKD